MREIVLDTETTGLNPRGGDRVVEIGCVELFNHIATGETFQVYINPERDMPVEAFEVHGLSEEFLSDKPKFGEVAENFLKFIDDAVLVIHNASFDMGFLNAELERTEHATIPEEQVLDTLAIARAKHPAASNSLDALCRRYNVDNSGREKHGALLDSELLAEVYLELIGGRQPDLVLVSTPEAVENDAVAAHTVRPRPSPLPGRLSDAEAKAHDAFVATLGYEAVWRRYDD